MRPKRKAWLLWFTAHRIVALLSVFPGNMVADACARLYNSQANGLDY
jgi:hypothetical protein